VFGLLAAGAAQTPANPIVWPPGGDIVPFNDYYNNYPSRMIENPQGLVHIYLYLLPWESGPALGCHFAAPIPGCFNAELIGVTSPFTLTIGSPLTGMAIAFGQCLSGPVYLARLTFVAEGATECCFYWVTADPKAPTGRIEIADCNEGKFLGTGGAVILNPNDHDCMEYVPARSSTWGKVKALYAL
jgi:hypothetical protein